MMKAMIYSPYWDTLGGGEKYCAAVVKVLLDLEYDVDIFWNDTDLTENVLSRYGIDIDKAGVKKQGFLDMTTGNFWHKKNAMWGYDVVFFVSDGSLPFLYGQQKNIVHFQVPFHDVGGKSKMNKLKRMTINEVVCNSLFTKQVIDAEFKVDSQVLYPPATMIKPSDKENLILSVGRFDNLMQSKRQDVMIDAFAKAEMKGWKLVLAGGMLHGSDEVEKLRNQIGKNKIELVVNPTWEEIEFLYSTASIYWHAAGYQVDISNFPEKVEHFGISTVEAMSAGAVPLVFNGGGLREIVSQNTDGYLWDDVDELISYTKKLVENESLRNKMSKSAQASSKKFSMEVFEREFKKIVS